MITCNYGNNMSECVQYIESFYIFENGIKREINKNTLNFKLFKKGVGIALKRARVMPAFGVSLHSETQNALKKDMWLQINFNKKQEINGLPFDALLVKLEVASGVNLIRLYDGKYEGRCIYLEFDEIYNFKDIISKFN